MIRARKALALPLVAILAVAGGLLVAGCGGSDDDSAGNGTTLQSQNAAETGPGDEAMKEDEAMKKEGDAMKHEGDAMKQEGDAMKQEGDAMKQEGDAMKHDDAMQKE